MSDTHEARTAREITDVVKNKTQGLSDGLRRQVIEKIIRALQEWRDQLPRPDNTLPDAGDGNRPDNTLPGAGGGNRPDNTLPDAGGVNRPDNTLPGEEP